MGFDDAFGNEFSVDYGGTDLLRSSAVCTPMAASHSSQRGPILGRLVTGEFMAGACRTPLPLSKRFSMIRVMRAFLLSTLLLAVRLQAGEIIPVWPDLAPGETDRLTGTALAPREADPTITRVEGITSPTLQVMRPKETANGTAVVILPGGGFRYVVPNLEGSEAGEILNALGITAFVLNYRTTSAGPAGAWKRPLQDSQRAIRLIRANAAEWNLNPDKVGLLAFSAGGQVGAIHIGDHGDAYKAIDAVDTQSARPDFAMLVYPWQLADGKTGDLMPDITLSDQAPPTFIVHTHDDQSSSLGAAGVYVALKMHNVPAEIHVYETGGHGYGTRVRAKSNISTWTDRATDWLVNRRLADRPNEDPLSGEAKLWHKLTLQFDGPETSESASPNPFTDYRLDVTFSHGAKSLVVPGYYAADGDAANTSASGGHQWRAHFSPDAIGTWQWKASFRKGTGVATEESTNAGESAGFFDGDSGSFTVTATDKSAPDLRALGRLATNGTRYPRTLGTGDIFLKAGADAPENFLAYSDFDGDFKTDGKKDHLVKTWEPHVQDWQTNNPTWSQDKGKGMIGAINYLASKGMNAVSFLTLNIAGDDRNVFPYTSYEERTRLDVSRLAQWEVIFEHATSKGLFLHFKTQESENETLLDSGDTGPQRRLYYRELIARFGHHPALNWNLGEENGEWGKNHYKEHFQSKKQRIAMTTYFAQNDPYQHPVVIHNGQWPSDLSGPDIPLTGVSLQTNKTTFENVHESTLRLIRDSANAGKPWIVACDEPGDAQHGLIPDEEDPTRFHARTNALWGHFLAGGWGIEWYFGYAHPHSDLTCQDYRLRETMWEQSAHALRFFRDQRLPLDRMESADDLLSGSTGFCLATPGEVYVALVIDPSKDASLNLSDKPGNYRVQWFDPRNGGGLKDGSHPLIQGGTAPSLGTPPNDPNKDWVALVRRQW